MIILEIWIWSNFLSWCSKSFMFWFQTNFGKLTVVEVLCSISQLFTHNVGEVIKGGIELVVVYHGACILDGNCSYLRNDLRSCSDKLTTNALWRLGWNDNILNYWFSDIFFFSHDFCSSFSFCFNQALFFDQSFAYDLFVLGSELVLINSIFYKLQTIFDIGNFGFDRWRSSIFGSGLFVFEWDNFLFEIWVNEFSKLGTPLIYLFGDFGFLGIEMAGLFLFVIIIIVIICHTQNFMTFFKIIYNPPN